MFKIGDTIKCSSKAEIIELSYELARENIMTDFLYEKDGETGLWLEIIQVGAAND